MQTKQTQRLAKKIRKLRERKKPFTWHAVCEKLNIRTEDGRHDPGLAYKIAYREYEPSDRAMRTRLGLRDICTKCKRGFRVPHPKEHRALSPSRAWWQKLKGGERERVIELAYRNYLNWRKQKG